MPIYESKGLLYNVPDNKVDYFLSKRMDAKRYEMPVVQDRVDIESPSVRPLGEGERTFQDSWTDPDVSKRRVALLNAAQKQTRFLKTPAGDAMERLGAGILRAEGGVAAVQDAAQNIPLTGPWALKKLTGIISRRLGIKTPDIKMGDQLLGVAETLSERGHGLGNVIDPETGMVRAKKYSDQMKEGKHGNALGDIIPKCPLATH